MKKNMLGHSISTMTRAKYSGHDKRKKDKN